FGRDPIRIAPSVVMLVTAPYDRAHLREALDRREDLLSELRVLLHDLPLFGVERTRLQQDARRDSDLADVVEECAKLELFQRLRVEPERRAHLQCGVGDPARMRRGVL